MYEIEVRMYEKEWKFLRVFDKINVYIETKSTCEKNQSCLHL